MRRSATAGPRGKVLVVDDEPMILDLARILLEGAGFAVATARSAAGLPAIVEAEAPEVVVLDVGLPGLKGDRAVEAIRANAGGRPVAVILYSGEHEDDLRELARRAGADRAVAKSSAPSSLLEIIEDAMRGVWGQMAPGNATEG